MASTKRWTIPEGQAEQEVSDSIERLDKLRVSELNVIAAAQEWKSAVLRAELERLEPILTLEHPRLTRIQALLNHYGQSREAIAILLKGKDEEQPKPGESWELTGTVQSEKLDSPAGLKVVLEPPKKELASLEAECDETGFYRIMLEANSMRQYAGIPMLLKVYYKDEKAIFTADKPIFIVAGELRQDIRI